MCSSHSTITSSYSLHEQDLSRWRSQQISQSWLSRSAIGQSEWTGNEAAACICRIVIIEWKSILSKVFVRILSACGYKGNQPFETQINILVMLCQKRTTPFRPVQGFLPNLVGMGYRSLTGFGWGSARSTALRSNCSESEPILLSEPCHGAFIHSAALPKVVLNNYTLPNTSCFTSMEWGTRKQTENGMQCEEPSTRVFPLPAYQLAGVSWVPFISPCNMAIQLNLHRRLQNDAAL